jgi:hypothetical protein
MAQSSYCDTWTLPTVSLFQSTCRETTNNSAPGDLVMPDKPRNHRESAGNDESDDAGIETMTRPDPIGSRSGPWPLPLPSSNQPRTEVQGQEQRESRHCLQPPLPSTALIPDHRWWRHRPWHSRGGAVAAAPGRRLEGPPPPPRRRGFAWRRSRRRRVGK